jgi:dipeptidyl aminopeptidase/acylaminoacyl peptidase
MKVDRIVISAVALMLPLSLAAQTGSFTLEQALSAPFASNLSPAPHLNRFVWVEDEQGKRNLWVAEPDSSGKYQSKRLTAYLEDDGQEIDEIEWTPDAENLIYVRGGDFEFPGTPDPNPALNPDGVSQTIWSIAFHGGKPHKLAEGREPAISPRGDQLVYINHDQIWTVGLSKTAEKSALLLHIRGEISELTWAPDGHAVAFVSDRGDHAFIGVYDMHAKTLAYLDPRTGNDQAPTWSPDSRSVAFIREPGEPQPAAANHRTASPWSLIIADASTGKGHSIWTAAQGRGSAFHELHGTQLLWCADDHLVFPWEHDGWQHLYSVSTSGGEAHLLTPGDFEVQDVSSVDKKNILYSSNQQDIDRRHIWTVPVSGGSPKAITHGTGIEVSPVSNGQQLVVLRSDEHTPLRPALVGKNGSLEDLVPQIIPVDYAGSHFVKPQQVIFPAADGLQIHGQLFLPRDAKDGRRHPALVFFHGGSRRQMMLGFHTMGYYSNAYAMNQYLASRGYIVLSVNYRSGIGYGLDFREALHYGRDGASEFNDILGSGKYLQSRADVDAARIGVWGGSYGGFLTALALARSSDIFAAGVDMHGVHQWLLPSSWHSTHDPEVDAQRAKTAWESSPMAYLSTWRSPVLLIQGDDDRNVPFSQTVSLARALQRQGVSFEEMVFPDEIHGFLLHRHWLEAYHAEADFFDRHLLSSTKAK